MPTNVPHHMHFLLLIIPTDICHQQCKYLIISSLYCTPLWKFFKVVVIATVLIDIQANNFDPAEFSSYSIVTSISCLTYLKFDYENLHFQSNKW